MKTIIPTGQDKVLAVLKTGVALTAKNKYRLGAPTRAVVAAGYRALANA